MATQIVVTAGPVQSAKVRRTKPRKLFRGVKRTLIRKTLAKMQSITNSDTRDYNRGLIVGFDPALVIADDNSVNGRSWTRIMDRLRACLDALEGDE